MTTPIRDLSRTGSSILQNIRYDWQGWSRSEGFTAALVAAAFAYLAAVTMLGPQIERWLN
jgi:hypothetical protein